MREIQDIQWWPPLLSNAELREKLFVKSERIRQLEYQNSVLRVVSSSAIGPLKEVVASCKVNGPCINCDLAMRSIDQIEAALEIGQLKIPRG